MFGRSQPLAKRHRPADYSRKWSWIVSEYAVIQTPFPCGKELTVSKSTGRDLLAESHHPVVDIVDRDQNAGFRYFVVSIVLSPIQSSRPRDPVYKSFHVRV